MALVTNEIQQMDAHLAEDRLGSRLRIRGSDGGRTDGWRGIES
jgi:hypothetical protein